MANLGHDKPNKLVNGLMIPCSKENMWEALNYQFRNIALATSTSKMESGRAALDKGKVTAAEPAL